MQHGRRSDFGTQSGMLGVDLRTRAKRLGAKEKARRKKCKVRFSLIKKNKTFQKNYMKVGVKKLLQAGHGASKDVGVKLRRQMAAAAGKKKEYNILCPCSWKHLAWKWRTPCPLSTGQREPGVGSGILSRKKLG